MSQVVDNLLLIIHDLNSSLLGTVVKSDNTIRDSLSLDQFNPSDLSSAVTMSSATGFSIDTLNIDNSELIARYYTTLIKMETILELGLSLVHERLGDRVAIVDDSIGLILDGHFFLLAQGLVMSDIQVSNN